MAGRLGAHGAGAARDRAAAGGAPGAAGELPSESGGAIHGWLVPGAPGRGGIVLAHSVRSNRLEMVGRAEFLHRAGHPLLLFDEQAHGESPGRRITFGQLESHDARAAVAFARARWPDARIGYLGVSQGGAAALLGADPLAVDALVVEAVYPTLREAVANRIAIRLGPLASILAPILLLQVEPKELWVVPGAAHVDFHRFAPAKYERRVLAFFARALAD
jgi:fermentation-respiration switch protein FrsA (DUF1100 family)